MVDQVDLDSPKILKQLNNFINLNVTDKDEALVYALAQLLHDRIKSLDMEEEEKGALVGQLIDNFAEFNKIPLAMWKERLRLVAEQKASTTH